MGERTNRTLTFRVAITAAVLAIITALTASLTFIQLETFHAAARAAASATMDAASANTLSRLGGDISELSSVVRVLSSNPSLTDSDDRSETDGAIALFKTALHELPQADSGVDFLQLPVHAELRALPRHGEAEVLELMRLLYEP